MADRADHLSQADTEATPTPAAGAEGRLVVVGIGASAGGLDAFERFLKQMPPDPRIAVVLVQHLDPLHESRLPELLARAARMPVQVVQDETLVAPGHVYVIPPNTSLTLEAGVLRLNPPTAPHGFRTPIDGFLASLAEDQGDHAVGIVLSGAGSDGTLGLRVIQERGGLTLAQAPESATYDGMPQSAIAAGVVDHILLPEEMPAHLLEHVRQLEELAPAEGPGGQRETTAEYIARICAVVRRKTGHDFSDYKQNTLIRRIHRRMAALQMESPAQYADRLEHDAREADLLFQELLIGVTGFFRDPEAFETLGQLVIPRLFEGKGAADRVRVWAVGCSSGEEAYSLAILLYEWMAQLEASVRVQIFATDIDEESLETARQGYYPKSIRENVSPARLERFFTREDDGYRVGREIREMCIFSLHNVIHHPPFAELDLISCRNLLIYLDNRIQTRLMALFHYALRPGGFLFLGSSENIAGRTDLFDPLDRAQRISQRKKVAIHTVGELPMVHPFRHRLPELAPPAPREAGALKALDRAILDEYTPAGMVVKEDGEITYFFGPIGPYLEPSSGVPVLNVANLVRKEMRMEVRAALHEAIKMRDRVAPPGISLHRGRDTQRINLLVRPLTELGPDAGLYLVVFQELVASERRPVPRAGQAGRAADEAMIQQLQNELRSAREQWQSTVEEVETSNEELQSANEEFLSMNEELQSANEELQSSKEELQSTNEELQSVNAELGRKVEELDTVNADLQSLFEGTQIATLFLDNDLHIKRFTPTATDLFRLREGDVGRPVTDIAARFTGGDIVAEIREVLRTLQRRELLVRQTDGEMSYLVRILPYRTRQNMIDGVAIVFVDVTDREEALRALREADRSKDEFLAMLAHELRNPLAAVSNAIQLLNLGGSGDPTLQLAREVAERQATHMTRLLDDLLDVSRITHGKIELRKQPWDLRTILEEVIQGAAPGIEARGQRLTVSLPPDPLPVEADRDRLQQVAANLLNNAAKYTPSGGHIHLSAERENGQAPGSGPGQAVVRVKDDGMGIPPEVLPHVFDLFVQADRTLDRSQGGLGIGLTMVKNLVEMHGGSVEAHSDGPGKGSELVVRLPLLPVSSAALSPVTSPAEAAVPASRRILLVEDNEDGARMFAMILEMKGHEVRIAHNGPEALAAAVEYRPEVVLLDIGLPGMSGYEVARRLREQGLVEGTILIAVTGYGQEEDIHRARQEGLGYHLTKPVDLAQLERILSTSAAELR